MNMRPQRVLRASSAIVALSLGLLVAAAVPSFGADLPDHIANDTVWYDTSGDPIAAQGGNVLREGSTYYWVGAGLTDPKSVNLYSSPDLTNWTFENTILRQSGTTGDLATGAWLGRPQLAKNPRTGQYVLAAEVNGPAEGPGNALLLATSATIDGVYTPVGPAGLVNGRTMGDHTLFVEGDDAYLVYVGDSEDARNVSVNVAPLNADWTAVEPAISESADYVREAPAIVKIGPSYYMFASGRNWWDATPTSYRTSTDLVDWSEWSTVATEPFSDNSFGTQFAQVIPITGDAGTSYLYNGDRYSQFRGGGTPAPGGIGLNAWYPLTFDGGAPMLHGATDVRVNTARGMLTVNEVANGRFDQDVTGTRIPQWDLVGPPDTIKVEAADRAADHRQLAMWSAGAYSARAGQRLSLPNGTYRLSFDYRSSGGQTTAFVGIDGHGDLDLRADIAGAQTTWASQSLEFTVTTGTAHLVISTDAPGNTWINVDNISVMQQDTSPPLITAPSSTNLVVGDAFDPLAGVSAQDEVDGDLSAQLSVIGSVDTSRAGTYAIAYVVSDAAGNRASADRTINVSPAAIAPDLPVPDDDSDVPPTEDGTPDTPAANDPASVDDASERSRTDRQGALAATGAPRAWYLEAGLALLVLGGAAFALRSLGRRRGERPTG